MTDVATILLAAADLLEPEGAWTKGAIARNAGGVAVGSRSPNACTWCAGGAIFRVSNGDMEVRQAMAFLGTYVGAQAVGDWNDSQPGPEPVVAALRAAAEKAS